MMKTNAEFVINIMADIGKKKAIRNVDIAASKFLLKGGRREGHLSVYIAAIGDL